MIYGPCGFECSVCWGEAERGDGTVRSRLFGQGMPLDDIERLTDAGFYATLAYKLRLTGREYSLGGGACGHSGQG